jgi:hypothetical protein
MNTNIEERKQLHEIQRIVYLVKEVNCENWATISEGEKEMGVKKTAVMQFINDNPKLFKVMPYIGGITSNAKAKNLGLVIKTVYNSAEENPETEEWLEAKKKAWENKIHIGEQTYYGCHEYWLIPEEGDGKEAKYRNTPEKIKFLEENGIIKKISGGYGGWGDYNRTEYYPYGDEVQKALEGIGWTTDFDEVSAKAKK